MGRKPNYESLRHSSQLVLSHSFSQYYRELVVAGLYSQESHPCRTALPHFHIHLNVSHMLQTPNCKSPFSSSCQPPMTHHTSLQHKAVPWCPCIAVLIPLDCPMSDLLFLASFQKASQHCSRVLIFHVLIFHGINNSLLYLGGKIQKRFERITHEKISGASMSTFSRFVLKHPIQILPCHPRKFSKRFQQFQFLPMRKGPNVFPLENAWVLKRNLLYFARKIFRKTGKPRYQQVAIDFA